MGFLVISLSVSFPSQIPIKHPDNTVETKVQLSSFYFSSREMGKGHKMLINVIDFIFSESFPEHRLIYLYMQM